MCHGVCTSGESHITPAVLPMNIHRYLCISQSVFWIPASVGECCEVFTKIPLALRCVLKLTTITSIMLLYQTLGIQVLQNAAQNALLGYDSLINLMIASLHLASSHPFLQAPSDWNALHWWRHETRSDDFGSPKWAVGWLWFRGPVTLLWIATCTHIGIS